MESMALAGAGLTTAFGELLKAVIETKHAAVGFSSILNRLQVTIESLIPILKEIDELKIEVDYGKEELEAVVYMEALLKKGVDLVRKCSKVTRLNLYKRTKYTTKLQELDDSIIRFVKKHYPDTLSEKSDEERVGGVEAKLENSSNLSHDSETDVEEGHPSVMQHHSGMTEPPNDGELLKDKSRLVLMQAGLGLTVPPKEEEWGEAEEIHLMDNELSELPERPLCSILSELYLQGNYKLRKIPYSFFEHMPALQVLNLSKTGIRSLPDSLFRLVGLKKLFLNCCENFMMLSPKVGELKCLEVLNLEGTEVIDLPKEIEKLTNLKCLKVSFYGYINDGRKKEQSNAMIHGGVISALSKLEELNIDVNPDDERWGMSVEAIFDEIRSLMQLRTLKFYFPGVELLRQFKWFPVQPSLSHFRFIVGHHSKRIISRLPQDAEFELKNWDRCLTYIYGEGVPEEIKKVLQYATAFHLDRHTTVKKLSEFGIENMEQLKCCIVGECNEIQVLIDGRDVYEEDHSREIVPESSSDKRIGLEALEYLNIYYMKNLRSIWKGPVHGKCLSLLKLLTLRTCPELTTIFTLFFLENFYNLEELTIEDCPAVKSLVSCENPSKPESSSSTRFYFLPKLKKISLYYVPELVSISNGVCIAPKLECLAFYNCPSLKSLSIEEVCSTYLKMIVGEKDWWDALEWRNGRPDNLDGIFVPINADDLTNTMDNRHSSFLSPSHALKQKWSPSQQQGFSISTGGTDLSSVTSKASYSVGKGWTDLSSMTSKASSFSVPSSKGKENTATSPSMPRSPGRAENPTSLRSRWKKGKLLGRGTFGHVYVVFHSETGAMGAMKEATLFSDDAKSKESAKQLVQEISILSNLRHPNIVQYYGAETVDDKLYIFQEYVSGGSIFKLLQDYGQFGEPAICRYTQEILSGLAYLHAKNIVHRDIKGANILVDPNGRVKLADFGVADHITRQSCPSLSFKGGPYWMAPEVIKNSNGCNLAVDIWSLGCTILEMATTKPPWSQFEGVAAMFKIGNSQELPVIPDHLSIEGKDFVRQCLQRNPLHRPTAAQLLEHRFMKKASLAYSGSMPSWHSDPPPGVKNGVKSLGIGQARNLSSLDSESLLQGIGQARNHSSLDSESLQSIQLEF